MQKAAAGNFMAVTRDAANEFRISFGNPAENEECGFGVVFIQQRQRVFCVFLQAGFKAIPVAGTDVLVKDARLEIVFQIDGQDLSPQRFSRARRSDCRIWSRVGLSDHMQHSVAGLEAAATEVAKRHPGSAQRQPETLTI